MARILRKLTKVFASSATNNGQFGSGQASGGVTSDDIDVLQQLPAFESGWNSATISSSNLPTIEEFQALNYINTTQLKYLFQQGIPEFLATETYYTSSVVKKSGTYELYGSLVNDNLGNALPDQVNDANWQYLGDLAVLRDAGGSSGTPVGSIIMLPRNNIPTGYLECNGATFDAGTYPDLNTYLGGTTLPDMRGEFPRGWDNGRGVDSGRAIASSQSDQMERHSHQSPMRVDQNLSGTGGAWDNINSFTSVTAGRVVARSNSSVTTARPNTQNVGGTSNSSETRPRNVALIFAIKAE